MNNDVVRSVFPIIFLIGLGFLSRKLGILKAGDERVLNMYIYYFALPALFFVDLAEIRFTSGNVRFVYAGIFPIIIAFALYVIIYLLLGFSKNTLYLLILSTVFGSLAFYGIPFIMFAFPTPESEKLATLAAASISLVSVIISIIILEFYSLEKTSVGNGLKRVARRLSRNPLILSIIFGVLLSLGNVEIPALIATPLHMLGVTTAPVAIFLLGVFLYGREYTNLTKALGLSLLRIIFLPVIALLVTSLLGLPKLEKTILTLMHCMPVAISMIVLSERYNFFKQTIASLILVSSISAVLYLNVWLWILLML